MNKPHQQVTYWDYIGLDAMLARINPVSNEPDERAFIVFHQMIELCFSMILHELDQVLQTDSVPERLFVQKVSRANGYLKQIFSIFETMSTSLDKAQFQRFRRMLFPASGFQSMQFRLIQLYSTDIENLKISNDHITGVSTLEEADLLYWRVAARKLDSNNSTLQLFDMRYLDELLEAIEKTKNQNLWKVYKANYQTSGDGELAEALRQYDRHVNLLWATMHMKLASFYLDGDSKHYTPSTGGTNWKNYLHPAQQKIIFFPGLWSKEEIAEWGQYNPYLTLAPQAH
jgi:tryptophan 2,3-dioxygenase